MTPTTFPESNTVIGPPKDLDESQCLSVPAYRGQIQRGSLEGLDIVVTAWQPSPAEIELIKAGKPILIAFIGGLPPHLPGMDFEQITHPA